MKPIIAITMGDPTGIGPEIAAKALASKEIYNICKPIIIGNKEIMGEAVKISGLDLKINPIKKISDCKYIYGIIDVYHLDNFGIKDLVYGKVNKKAGKAAGDYIKKAIELALNKEVDATTTCPIHKEALNLGGYTYNGHTEFYATLTNTKNYSMMLMHENLRVVHVSTHCSLMDAINKVKKNRILEVIKIANEACLNLGIKNPKIGVAGLNPHAGDNGLFGDEEKKEISIAVEEAKNLGFDVYGPIPPDIIFARAKGGVYDIVVAMYHDQGHIPIKLLGFNCNKDGEWTSVKGINVTLGLPIIRTSVDHGVAFGKAGKGKASEESLVDAIKTAVILAKNKPR